MVPGEKHVNSQKHIRKLESERRDFENMCATATNTSDIPSVHCVVKDMVLALTTYLESSTHKTASSNSNDSQTNSKELTRGDTVFSSDFHFSASTSAKFLFYEVARKFNYSADSFDLLLTEEFIGQRAGKESKVFINRNTEGTLEELGFSCEENEKNLLVINHNSPQDVSSSGDAAEADTAHGPSTEKSYTRNFHYVPPPTPPPYSPDFSYNYSQAAAPQETGFVGLVNQAMTCYLNSLLQTLYMTPEFRNALYRWEFDGTEEEGTRSIPFQLQKLFLQLQISKKPAVGTTDLTTSFGWDSSEAWQQHDVQELCRVMFDALEQKFKNTEQSDLISTLYEGKMKDYVKCLECNYESAREDTFLDVPLVVRPFGSSQAYTSVGEALRAFVTPETLQGSNQYYCEHCAKKCDAHKGLKFTSFPYMLTLQLKRFDFDPQTMHRIKLNDRVSFPEILNLNEFVKSENTESSPEEESEASPESVDDDEGIDVDSHSEAAEDSCSSEKNLKKPALKGPYMYELFSIMVHSGSANGGHYYAYIKSFKLGEWYCFNDANVTQITTEDIQKTYGGGPSRGYYSSAYSSSTNAYMLMYRQIDKEKNTGVLSPNDFPEHIKVLLQCMQEQDERERVQKELDLSSCRIKLFCQHPTSKRMIEKVLKVHKDCTLSEATETAYTIMELQGMVSLDCCRLVKYDELSDSLESSFKGSDQMPMGRLLGGVRASYKFDLFLEIRKPDEVFEDYQPGGTTIKLHVVDLEKEDVATHPLTIRSHPSNTVHELQTQIAQSLGIASHSNVRIVLEMYSNKYKLLADPAQTLNSEGFKKSNKIFVEYQNPEDAERPYTESQLFKVMDCYSHTICLHVSLPKIDKASLDRLRIHNGTSEELSDISSDEEPEADLSTSNRQDGNYTKNEPLHLLADAFNSSEIVGKTYSRNFYDQSEDSSSSERTLVGEEPSPRNNSPEPDASPEDSAPVHTNAEVYVCKNESKPVRRYFRAWPYTDYETKEKMLRVYVDKRITLMELKKELESHIGLESEYFKIHRVYSNSQEFECHRLSENLMSYGDETHLTVKLGRALRDGEYSVKVFQLCVNEPETIKSLIEWALVKGMTILKFKKEILPQIKETCNLDIPLNRCRLRKKSWKNPGTVYFDQQRFIKDINVNPNWEIFLEVLPDAEPVTSPDHVTVFTRRWHPAVYKFDPFVEIILDDKTPQTLMRKICELSGIPEESIEIAKGTGTFPCEISVLSAHKELDWITLSTYNESPCIGADENVLFYRDKREELKKLTDEEKNEIENKETSKSNKIKLKNYYSPKKEKALKIYTVDTVPSNKCRTVIEPDLD